MLAREHVKVLIDQLTEKQLQALEVILSSMAHSKGDGAERDSEEDRIWLDADLGEVPPYDWGPEGVPEGQPVQYSPGVGLLVVGGKKHG